MSLLKEPVAEGRDHIEGSSKATVTLVEYGDYQCPHCAAAYSVVKEAQTRLGDKMRFVFRNFPLTEAHPYAELAAEAAEAAGAQGRFWEMHDALYENQDFLGEELIIRLARELALDVDVLISDIKDRKFKERVRQDFMSGVRSGVNGTPGLFINGEFFGGNWSNDGLYEALAKAISGA